MGLFGNKVNSEMHLIDQLQRINRKNNSNDFKYDFQNIKYLYGIDLICVGFGCYEKLDRERKILIYFKYFLRKILIYFKNF